MALTQHMEIVVQVSMTMIGFLVVGVIFYMENVLAHFTYGRSELQGLFVSSFLLVLALFTAPSALGLMYIQVDYVGVAALGLSWWAATALVIVAGARLWEVSSRFMRMMNPDDTLSFLALRVWVVLIGLFISSPILQSLYVANGHLRWVGGPLRLAPKTFLYTADLGVLFGYLILLQLLFGPFNFLDAIRKHRLSMASQFGEEPGVPTWTEQEQKAGAVQLKRALIEEGFTDQAQSLETYDPDVSANYQDVFMLPWPRIDEFGKVSLSLAIPDAWRDRNELIHLLVEILRYLTRITVRALPESGDIHVILSRYGIDMARDYQDGKTFHKPETLLAAVIPHSVAGSLETLEPTEFLSSITVSTRSPLLYPLKYGAEVVDPTEWEVERGSFLLFEFSDISHGLAKRASAKIVVSPGQSKEELLSIIEGAVQAVREKEDGWDKRTVKRWGSQPSQVIWLMVFDEVHNRSEMIAVFPHCVAHCLWIDSSLEETARPLTNPGWTRISNELEIRWRNP